MTTPEPQVQRGARPAWTRMTVGQEASSSGSGQGGVVIDYRMTHVAIQEKLSLTVKEDAWETFAMAASQLRKAVSSGGEVINMEIN